MNRFIIILGTLCLGLTLSAQPGVISTRPANDSKGKILTTAETTLSRELVPHWYSHRWEESPQAEFPKEFTKGKSLYIVKSEGDTVLVAESENPQITYGQVVSRNEFGIEGGTFLSPSREHLTFYRKD